MNLRGLALRNAVGSKK